MRLRQLPHDRLQWLRFEAGPRFVETYAIDGSPVRIALGGQCAGATVVDPATGATWPLPADRKLDIGDLPALVCKR